MTGNHDCSEHFEHSQTTDIEGDSRYERGTCRKCGRDLRMVWKKVGVMDAETGEYLTE